MTDRGDPPPARHVALVGLSGTGKSTVAPLLAARLGLAVVDLDAEVAAAAGRPVAEVFAVDGEPAFRAAESAALARALAGPPAVVATGGGVVLDPANRARLRQGAVVVWLRAEPEVLLARLADSSESRPLLAGDAATTLRRQAAEREAHYAEVADVVVDLGADGPRPGDLAEHLATLVQRSGGSAATDHDHGPTP